MVIRGQQRGDTLVEVLMAIVILSIVIVGAITLMSRGLSAVEAAVEHTEVRESINGQTEMLRYLRDGYVTNPTGIAGQAWLSLFSGTTPYADSTVSVQDNGCTITPSKSPFFLQENTTDVTVQPFNGSLQPATAATPGQGLWIEATRSPNGVEPAYVDFQIRGCWTVPGSPVTQQVITLERLYDPAH